MPPPLLEAMENLFFLRGVTSLCVLALHSEGFSLFCLLTMNLWGVGLDSGRHVWAKWS